MHMGVSAHIAARAASVHMWGDLRGDADPDSLAPLHALLDATRALVSSLSACPARPCAAPRLF